ncbi:MAG: hypothetical protein HGA85_03450 [Nanoarchaeota archaeon]|nr:hypothetical protein [Nanoarchaeota archaeon]
MTTTDGSEVTPDLSGARKDISVLRTELNELNDKKEELFGQKDKFSKQIVALINEIKTLKRERDEFTQKVRSLKEERKLVNDEIRDESEVLKKLADEKDLLRKDNQIGGNPEQIKKKIEELEFKIETEGMSFDKEKKVMQKINEFKKELDGTKGFSELFEKLKVSRNKIRDLRKKANTIHRAVQENAKNSQDRHEKLLALSKEIDQLKTNESELYSKFLSAKEDFNKVNDSLKEKLVGINSINEEIKKQKQKVKAETKEKETKTLAEKSKQVDDKIKERKKLTTEDLLIYQRTMVEKPSSETKDSDEE